MNRITPFNRVSLVRLFPTRSEALPGQAGSRREQFDKLPVAGKEYTITISYNHFTALQLQQAIDLAG